MSSVSVLRTAALVLLAPTAVLAGPRLEQQWSRPGWERRPFAKFAVVAIAADLQARKNFENKFVSHLRGREAEAAVSYEVAPDLTALPSRGLVGEFIAGQHIDAMISVRLVPVERDGEAAWAEAWRTESAGSQTLRELIDSSLPLAQGGSSRYGVEVSLWDADTRLRLWSGRTGIHGIKELRKSAGDFVQLVLDALKLEQLL